MQEALQTPLPLSPLTTPHPPPTHPLPCRYKKQDNAFYAFADDIVPRHVTAALHLDYDTMAGADRFGNVFVSRLPPEISAQVRACVGKPVGCCWVKGVCAGLLAGWLAGCRVRV